MSTLGHSSLSQFRGYSGKRPNSSNFLHQEASISGDPAVLRPHDLLLH